MITRLKGTDDILPPESHRWRRLLRAFDELAERYGYDLALMPAIEQVELFSRGVGEHTEVVEKQMYTFVDQGGRDVALRPEFTAGIVRAYVESGEQGVLKVAAAGPQFRYEQPQKGRRRQFYQIDLEYLGEASPVADIEIVEFSYRLLEMVGIGGLTVRINSIGDPEDRVSYRGILQEFLRGRLDSLSADARARVDTNPLRVLDSKADQESVADAPVPLDHLGEAASVAFDEVCSGLKRLGIPYEVDSRLVRGLDYYNRTVFEIFSSSFEAAQASLCGGGRYDPLAQLIGSKSEIAAVGVALGCDRIVSAMPAGDGPRLDVFVAVADDDRRPDALELVARLRGEGLRTDWSPTPGRSLKAQLRTANRLGAGAVAVVGEEWSDGLVSVRSFAGDEEGKIRIEEVAGWIEAR